MLKLLGIGVMVIVALEGIQAFFIGKMAEHNGAAWFVLFLSLAISGFGLLLLI